MLNDPAVLSMNYDLTACRGANLVECHGQCFTLGPERFGPSALFLDRPAIVCTENVKSSIGHDTPP